MPPGGAHSAVAAGGGAGLLPPGLPLPGAETKVCRRQLTRERKQRGKRETQRPGPRDGDGDEKQGRLRKIHAEMDRDRDTGKLRQ